MKERRNFEGGFFLDDLPPGQKKDNLIERFGLLLDIEYQEHVISVMHEWCFSKDKKLNAKRAELVSKEICMPLTAWCDSEYRDGGLCGNAADMTATRDFLQKADDIVYMLRHNTRPPYPEHISIFNDAWSFFQRSIAHRLHIRSSVLQDAVGKLPLLVNEEIERRERQAAEDAKSGARRWQKTGTNAARKYWEDDFDDWLLKARKIIKKNPSISARKLGKVIAEKLYDPKEAEKAAETIRKHKPITNLLKKANK